jgi:tight adherence protein B
VLPAVVGGAAPVVALATAAQGLHVTFGNGRFPTRALVVAAPASHPVTASTLHVQENSQAVRGESVTALRSANSGDFGVILLIDTSRSMVGRPLNQAFLAARTLAAERTGAQELGVIAFNKTVNDVLPLTNDASQIGSALARTPTTQIGTHLYDAALQAIQQLHASGVAAASVIVLSDGADFGSSSNQQAVASAAAADHVRVFTVGVRDRTFNPAALRSLARATRGSYTSAQASGLRRVFRRIESELTNRYLVRYRSVQALGHRIEVRVTLDGIPGAWTGSYQSPAAPTPVHDSAVNHAAPLPTPFWGSTIALLGVALASGLLFVGGLLAYFVPLARRQQLRTRVGGFTGPEPVARTEDTRRLPGMIARVDVWLAGYRWWPSFKEEVEIAGIERPAAELLALTAIATLGVAALASVAVGSPFVSLPVCLVGPAVVKATVRWRADRRRRQFSDQLATQLEEIAGAMRAGHSVSASIATMTEHAAEPTRSEFQRAVADERLGASIDAALEPIARRMRCPEVRQLALVAALAQQTGGNMAEVLDQIAAGVRDQAELRRELDALTAQGRLARWIVSALPPGLLLVLTLVNGPYVSVLYHTVGGVLALIIAGGLLVLGSFVMRLILDAAR